MTKYLPIFIFVLLIAPGCASLSPLVSNQNDPSEALFVQVLEAPKSKRTEAMAQLEEDHPQSPWTSRARQIDDLLNSRDSLNSRIRDLERRNSGQIQKNRTLEVEIDRLRNDLEKLKQIIIDMENRSTI